MKKFIPLLILAFTVGCEHTPVENYKNVLNVFSILRTYDGQQFVKVDRTYKMDEQSEDIKNATVIIRSNHSVDTCHYHIPVYVTYDSIPANFNDTFYLYVYVPGLDSLCGSTIVPDSITFIHPAEGDSVLQSDSLVMKNDKGKYYKFTVYKEDSLLWQQEEQSSTTDSLMVIQFSWFILSAGNYKIQVETYDKNYTEYYCDNKDSCGVTGGLGVFGSAVTKTISLYLKD